MAARCARGSIKAFDRFEDVRAVSDADVARLLRAQEIDIAVDLKGHTEGARPGILAHRPCPVQVNYLGYPGTIGAPWLDYIIADAVVLPFDDQDFYSEKIVHLPHCYQANDARRADRRTPGPRRAEAGLAGDRLCLLLLQRGLEDHPGDIRCLDAAAEGSAAAACCGCWKTMPP